MPHKLPANNSAFCLIFNKTFIPVAFVEWDDNNKLGSKQLIC